MKSYLLVNATIANAIIATKQNVSGLIYRMDPY